MCENDNSSVKKYCPNCRTPLTEYGTGRFHCPACGTHLYLADDTIPLFLESPGEYGLKQNTGEYYGNTVPGPSEQLTCRMCNEPIDHGIYCRQCTFLQIEKLQQEDAEKRRFQRLTENYGKLRYKGRRDKNE